MLFRDEHEQQQERELDWFRVGYGEYRALAIYRQRIKKSSSTVWVLQEFDRQEDDTRFVNHHAVSIA